MQTNTSTQSVFKFTDITGRKVDDVSAKIVSATPSDPSAEIHTKIATAKLHAAREIKEFKEKTEAFIAYLESTALFPTIAESMRQTLIVQLLEETIEPTLANRRMMGIPLASFNTLRRDMFNALIAKYIDNVDK